MLPPPPEPPWAVIWGGGGGGRPGCCPRAPRAPGCCWGRSPPPPSGSAPTTTSSAGPAPFGGGCKGGGGQRAAAGIWRGVPIPPTCCTCRVSPILTLSSCEFLPWNSYSTRTTGGGWRGGLGGGGGAAVSGFCHPHWIGGGDGGVGVHSLLPPRISVCRGVPSQHLWGKSSGWGETEARGCAPPSPHPPSLPHTGWLSAVSMGGGSQPSENVGM